MPSGAIITTLGLAKLASATPLNQLNISALAVGDGNGGYPALTPSMTALTNEVWRGTPSPPIRDPNSPSVLIFEAVIPPSVGGFTVREQAIFDDAGDMIAIGQTSVVEKPLPNTATGVILTVRLHVQLDNAEQVDLFFQDDPTISAGNVSNANGGSVQDFIDAQYTTVAELATGKFSVGQYVRLIDRAMALFIIQVGGVANGYDILPSGFNTALYQHFGTVNVLHLGADSSGTALSTGSFLRAREILTTGRVYAPRGTYKIDKKLSFNSSALILLGDGSDLTYLNFYENAGDNYKTGVEINNGSWDDQLMTYASSGQSIGSSYIEGLSIVSVNKTDATGIVLARATKGCYLKDVKIVGWDVPYRAYGSWYAHFDEVISQNNSNGARIGYETNNFSVNGGNYANNTNAHIEFESVGTCRGVAFNGVAFDGLPAQFGVYVKNVSGLTFTGAGYVEIYDGDNNTQPMIQFGQNVVNVDISNLDIIFPTDDSYVGAAIKLGTGVGVGAVGVNISNIRQYNSSNGVSIDCTNAREVEFGTNVRLSSPTVLSIGEDTISTAVEVLTVPETTTTGEFKGLITVVRRPFSAPIKLQYMFAKNAVFAGQKLRILRGDTNAVVIEHDLGNEVGGQIVDLPILTGIINDVPLIAYTYKVGSSITWPAMTILCQQI